MKTRCKVVCQSVTDYGVSKEVKLQAQYDMTIPEDVRFNLASPNAMFSINISNPATMNFFEPQKAY